MAYATKYKIEFKDAKDNTFIIYIQPDADAGGPITILKPTADPLIWELPTADIYEPVQGTGVTLNFYNGGHDVSDLFTVDPFQVKIEIYYNAGLWWTGFLNTEQYTEDFSKENSPLSITANDGLAALKRVPYFTETTKPWQKGRATIGEILETCLSNINFTIYRPILDIINTDFSGPAATDWLTETEHDLSNYIDEDGVSASKREVLEQILKSYGYVLRLQGSTCYIFSPSKLKTAPLIATDYDRSFSSGASGAVNNKIDIADADFKFMNAAQRITMQSGFSEMAINYSPYPDEKKVTPLKDIDLSKITTNWESLSFVNIFNENTDQGYYYRKSTDRDFDTELGLTFPGTKGFIIQCVNAKLNDSPHSFNADSTYLAIKDIIFTQPSTKEIVIYGGYIPKSTDRVTITFNFKLELPTAAYYYAFTKLELFMTVKIGTKWAKSSGLLNFWEMNGTTEEIIIPFYENANENLLWKDITFEMTFTDIDEGGELFLSINRSLKMYSFYDSAYQENLIAPTLLDTILLFNNFKVLINTYPVSETDIEIKGTTDPNWINKTTIETNHGDAREGGVLDRGLITTLGIPTATWYFAGDTSGFYDSINEILLRKFLSQYSTPYKQLTADIKLPTGYVTPITILMDSDNLGTSKFYLNGGSYNARTRIFNGTFDEIKDITETIL